MPQGSGIYFYWLRYVLPALPFMFIPLAFGMERMWMAHEHVSLVENRKHQKVILRTMALIVAGFMFYSCPKQIRLRADQFSWNCQNVNEINVAMGKWIRENVPPMARVMTNDAGAIKYYSTQQTIDLLGLNSHGILFSRTPMARTLADFISLMDTLKVNYLAIFPFWYQELVRAPQFGRYFKSIYETRSDYYTICNAPQDRMVLYRRIAQ
jgi:hypothetical protein